MPRLRSLLSLPSAYRLFWNAIGGRAYIRTLVGEYVEPQPGNRILDIGCGPGHVLPYLPEVEYTGFDLSPQYIETARQRFPQATFVCARVSQYTLPRHSCFDIVLALGVIHHLDGAEAVQLFQIARQALAPGGRLVTLDGAFVPGQSAVSRYLVRHDRGHFMRTEDGYVRLARKVFPEVDVFIRQDLLRIPYTHIIMKCAASSPTRAASGVSP
jgi:SAM-dependent methyltransferase